MDKLKNIFSVFLRVAFSAGLLFWLFKKIDFGKTVEIIKTADMMYVVWAGLIFAFINVLLLVRWVVIIRALDLNVPLITIVRYFFIGLFGNLFLPSAIGGDVIKILGLCRDNGQKPKVVASVILDRLSGFSGIVIVAIAAFIYGHKLMGDNFFIPIACMAIVSIGFTFVLFDERLFHFFCLVFNRIPKLKNALITMHNDILLLKDRKLDAFKAIALSIFTQVIFAFCFYFLAIALHQKVALIYFLIFVPIICVIASLPSIGGLGVREWGAAHLFARVGMDPGIAVSISLINFLFMVTIGLLGGLFYVTTLHTRRVQYPTSDAVIKPTEV